MTLGSSVAVNDPVFMRVGQRIGDLSAVAQHEFEREAFVRNLLAQRPPLHVLHGHVRLPGGFANIIDGADMWVIQC